MNSPSHLKTEGLILRSTRFEESHRFVRVLVPSGEVHELLARNVGKSRKRFGGGLEPLSLQLFEISRRRSTMVAEQAQHVNDYLALRADLPRFYLASYAAERVLAAAPCFGLYELMVSLLDNLSTTPPDLLAMKAAFDLKLLAISGLVPRLADCTACDQPLGPRPASLDPSGSGFHCPEHGDRSHATFSAGVRAVLSALADAPFSQVPRVKISADQRAGVKRCVEHFLDTHLAGAVKSAKLLKDYL